MTISGNSGEFSVAVVLPSYNESAHVASVIRSIPEWVDSIIIVDDASSDGTADVARATEDLRLTVIVHERNRGVGGATVTGYRAALELGYDIVVKMDADGQMDSNELARLVRPIAEGRADYTKGNRFLGNQGIGKMPRLRKAGSIVLSFLTKMSSGYWHVFDSQCGFTAATSTALRAVDLDGIATDYFFENDMLISLNEHDARVVDVPTSTRYGNEISSMSISRVLLTFPARLLYGGWRRAIVKYFVLDFGAMGMLLFAGNLLVLFGLVFGGYHWLLSQETGVVASTGTVMLAVLPLIAGVQILIQAFAMEVSQSPGAAETKAYSRGLDQLARQQ